MTTPRDELFECSSCDAGASSASSVPVEALGAVRCNPRKGPCPPQAWPKYKGPRFVAKTRKLKGGRKLEGVLDRRAGRFVRDPMHACAVASGSDADRSSLAAELESGTFIPFSKRFDIYRSEQGLWSVYDNKGGTLLMTAGPWKTKAGPAGWLKKHGNAKNVAKYFCPKPGRAKKVPPPRRGRPAASSESSPAPRPAPRPSTDDMAASPGYGPGTMAEPYSEEEHEAQRGYQEALASDEGFPRENPGRKASPKALSSLKRRVSALENKQAALAKGHKALAVKVNRIGGGVVAALKALGAQKNHLKRITSGK